jgi:hypothetical protein
MQLVGVDHAFPVVELALPARVERRRRHSLRQAVGARVGRGNVAEDTPELFADPAGLRAIGILGEWRGGLAAGDLLHDEERALEPSWVHFEPERFGHRHGRAVESAVREKLEVPLGLDQAVDRVPSQNQAPRARCAVLGPARDEAVGFAGCTAVDAGHVVHRHAGNVRHPVCDVGRKSRRDVCAHTRLTAPDRGCR